MSSPDPLPPEVVAYYETGREQNRLLNGIGQLELARTKDIILPYLPSPPAVILDVGGGPGVYSCWLASLGYQVHLIDAVPFLVEQARQASLNQPEHPITSCSVGDARRLHLHDGSVDAVLLFGPLYHLTNRQDRLVALHEAHRVLRGSGLLFAAGVSRFAFAFSRLILGVLDDPQFAPIVQQDLAKGLHVNPTARPGMFTTAFLHHPKDLSSEVREGGFRLESLLAVEGPAGMLQNFDEYWNDPVRREGLLSFLRSIESESSLLGVSTHILAVGRKIE